MGICLEELRSLARRFRTGLYVHPGHARLCLAWAASAGIGPSEPILERVGLWLGGGERAADIALRAAVFMYEFSPTARHACTSRQIGSLFGITDRNVRKHAQHLRASIFSKKESI